MKKYLLLVLMFLSFSTAYSQDSKASKLYDKAYKMIDEGNFSGAIKNFLKAIEADSTGDCGSGTKGKAHGELGYAYFHHGDTANAAKYFDKSIALDADNPFPLQNKAAMLSVQKRYDESFKLLEVLLSRHPEFAEGYLQRGVLYKVAGKKELALADFNKVLELNSKQKYLPDEVIKKVKEMIKECK